MTSGLVVSFDSAAGGVREAIAAEPVFTLGDEPGPSLAVVLEVPDASQSERWYEWLRRLPGVVSVEVVFVHWDQEQSEVPLAAT